MPITTRFMWQEGEVLPNKTDSLKKKDSNTLERGEFGEQIESQQKTTEALRHFTTEIPVKNERKGFTEAEGILSGKIVKGPLGFKEYQNLETTPVILRGSLNFRGIISPEDLKPFIDSMTEIVRALPEESTVFRLGHGSAAPVVGKTSEHLGYIWENYPQERPNMLPFKRLYGP